MSFSLSFSISLLPNSRTFSFCPVQRQIITATKEKNWGKIRIEYGVLRTQNPLKHREQWEYPLAFEYLSRRFLRWDFYILNFTSNFCRIFFPFHSCIYRKSFLLFWMKQRSERKRPATSFIAIVVDEKSKQVKNSTRKECEKSVLMHLLYPFNA